VQIHRVTLASADPAKQARFWCETLGVPVEVLEGRVDVQLARTTIAFEPSEAGEALCYHFAINIPRGRIESALEWLRERVDVLPFEDGSEVIRFDGIAADAVYFHDAGGNVVELMARSDLLYDDDRPFGPELLLEVTEIGIAAEDVGATSEAVGRALGAEVYWGGGEGLTAIGDAVGAVLVSPLGRGWIPTGLPALPAPTTIVAEGTQAGRAAIPGGPYVIEAVATTGR
jgi:catechol 2,3-dioxygenase-like lactoylglutathione lyase family enzyme